MIDKETLVQLNGFTLLKDYPVLPCPFCKAKKMKIDLDSYQDRNLSQDATEKFYEEMGLNALQMVGNSLDEGGLLNILAAIGATVLTFLAMDNSETKVFNCFFTCSSCKESISASGQSFQKNETRAIKVAHFSTPILFFEISKDLPQPVKNELLLAFAYFYSDISSSGHKLRKAIEHACTEMGYTIQNLNDNLLKLESLYPTVAESFMKVKNIGNRATHNCVSIEEVIESFIHTKSGLKTLTDDKAFD